MFADGCQQIGGCSKAERLLSVSKSVDEHHPMKQDRNEHTLRYTFTQELTGNRRGTHVRRSATAATDEGYRDGRANPRGLFFDQW